MKKYNKINSKNCYVKKGEKQMKKIISVSRKTGRKVMDLFDESEEDQDV